MCYEHRENLDTYNDHDEPDPIEQAVGILEQKMDRVIGQIDELTTELRQLSHRIDLLEQSMLGYREQEQAETQPTLLRSDCT